MTKRQPGDGADVSCAPAVRHQRCIYSVDKRENSSCGGHWNRRTHRGRLASPAPLPSPARCRCTARRMKSIRCSVDRQASCAVVPKPGFIVPPQQTRPAVGMVLALGAIASASAASRTSHKELRPRGAAGAPGRPRHDAREAPGIPGHLAESGQTAQSLLLREGECCCIMCGSSASSVR